MEGPTRTPAIVRTLVAGGAGFIGSHLCDRLIQQGSRVICVDDFSTGALQNIQHLLAHPGFELIRHDVTNPLQVEATELYNLACPASPVRYQRDAVQTLKTSVLGALHLLDLAKRLRAPVLQASTSEVYGDPEQHPQRESYWGHVNPIGVRACYDEGKRCAETLFWDFHRQHGVRIKIARVFNTYGPRMQIADGRVVSNFIVQALRNQPLTVYGDGSQTRCFCYVSDLVEALVALMRSPAAFTGPVNVGNTTEISMLELAEMIRSISGSKSRIARDPLPADDPRRRRPDTTLAKTALGWRPSVSLHEGLTRTIVYFDSVLRSAPDLAAIAV